MLPINYPLARHRFDRMNRKLQYPGIKVIGKDKYFELPAHGKNNDYYSWFPSTVFDNSKNAPGPPRPGCGRPMLRFQAMSRVCVREKSHCGHVTLGFHSHSPNPTVPKAQKHRFCNSNSS